MTADLTRPDRGEALERLTAKLQDLPDDEVGAYFLLCMAILAKNAPDVAVFIMDRADQSLADADEKIAAGLSDNPSSPGSEGRATSAATEGGEP